MNITRRTAALLADARSNGHVNGFGCGCYVLSDIAVPDLSPICSLWRLLRFTRTLRARLWKTRKPNDKVVAIYHGVRFFDSALNERRTAQLARAKGLPLEFLRNLGVKDRSDGIEIPYRLMDGSPARRLRIRCTLPPDKNKTIWNSVRGDITPYGLDRLDHARKTGFLVLVEGESDCWTLWHHNFPAMGIPGATMVSCVSLEYLKGIHKLFVFQEPDNAGDTFIKNIARRLCALKWNGEPFVVSLNGFKDPSELHIHDPLKFKGAFQAALDHVSPLQITAHSSGLECINQELRWERFSDIAAKAVQWLWPQRIPRAKLTIFSGNPDVAKTTIAIDVVARYTTGRDYPDGGKNSDLPGEVLMLIAEDDLADTILPRLIAAGADISKIRFLRSVEVRKGATRSERELALDTDLNLLEQTLQENLSVGLVVIDPITSYIGRADVNKEQELRRVLVPIKQLCERTDTTFICLGHFNKRGDVTALHRVGGAVAMAGVPRAVWMFLKDPEEAGLYKMLLGKGNLTKKRTGLKYRIVEKVVPGIGGAPTIVWDGETFDEVDDAFAIGHDPEAKKIAKAKRFLLDHFKDSPTAQPSQPIIDAAETRGISQATLFRARKQLGINAYQQARTWIWEKNSNFNGSQ